MLHYYVHLVSLEAGTSPEEDHQLSALWMRHLPSPQRLILCFHPILEGDSWEESQALLQILLEHFWPQSTQSQDCLVRFSLDISFSSVIAFSTVKCTQSLPLLKIYVSKMKIASSISLPLHISILSRLVR